MATLIPALGRCTARMPSGERRLAERLEPTQGGDPLPIHAARRLRRTTGPKAHYRNTRQILQTASLVAADLLTADEKNDEGIPLLKPVSCGREGQAPVIIKLPTLRDEAFAIAGHLASTHKRGLCLGRHGRAVRRLENHGPVRQRIGSTHAAASCAQKERRIPARCGRDSGDDHEGQQRAGVPRGGATRRGVHACGGGG